MYVQVNNELDKDDHPEIFNNHKFEESQFKKFMQVLDTDYQNYMLVYTCQDSAEWTVERTGQELSHEDVWNAYMNHYESKNGRKPTQNIYDHENFENL